MEKVQIQSDLSAQLIADPAQQVQGLIRHPEFGDRIVDMTAEEAARIGELAMKDPVSVTLKFPPAEGETEPRTEQHFLTQAAVAKVATRANIETVMDEAKPLVEPIQRPAAPRERVDYTSQAAFGIRHKGRVTDIEATMVRADLETANANRAKMGQIPIDPENPEDRKRYGFDTLDAAGEPAQPATLTEAVETAEADREEPAANTEDAPAPEPQLTLVPDPEAKE